MKRHLFYLTFALIFSVSCSDDGNGSSNAPGNFRGAATIPSVEAVQARYGSLPLEERLSGTVRAQNQVELYPEIGAPVVEVMAQNGDFVSKGDPLVRLRDNQFREQLEQARANSRVNEARLKQARARLQEMEANYKRIKTLAEKDLTSRQEVETLEAQLASAQADVDLAQAQLDQARSTMEERQEQLARTVVRAPISGTVGQRDAEVGMQAGPNTRLFIIGDLDHVRVEIVLTERMLNYINIGQTARVYPEPDQNGNNFIVAEISRISPFLNTVTRSTEAEIDIDNSQGRLRPGMFVPVSVLYGESRQATLVPASALYSNPTTGEEGIYVATTLGREVEPASEIDPQNPPPLTEPIQVEFKQVDVIARGRMEVAVAGINSGVWVVTLGQDLLSVGRNQARVRAISWDRILALQGMQRQDLLNQVLQQQQQNESSETDSSQESS